MRWVNVCHSDGCKIKFGQIGDWWFIPGTTSALYILEERKGKFLKILGSQNYQKIFIFLFCIMSSGGFKWYIQEANAGGGFLKDFCK